MPQSIRPQSSHGSAIRVVSSVTPWVAPAASACAARGRRSPPRLARTGTIAPHRIGGCWGSDRVDGGALGSSPAGAVAATSRIRVFRSGAMIPLTGPPVQFTAALGFFDQPSSTLIPGPSAPVRNRRYGHSPVRPSDSRRRWRAWRPVSGTCRWRNGTMAIDRRRSARSGKRSAANSGRRDSARAEPPSGARGGTCQMPSPIIAATASATMAVGISGACASARARSPAARASSVDRRAPAAPDVDEMNRNSHTTSTKCQYQAAASKPKCWRGREVAAVGADQADDQEDRADDARGSRGSRSP